MDLPAWVRARLEAAGFEARACSRLTGGMICHAARVTTRTGLIFVKWSEQASARMFDDEQDGLAALRSAQALRVPAVLAWGSRPDTQQGGYLVLEYLRASTPDDEKRFGERFGECLARLHLATAPGEGRYGYHRDNHLGMMLQPNEWRRHWWEFYRDCRIAPQVEHARSRGLLPGGRERLLRRVLDSMEALLGDAPDEPALVHGDLWSGNLLCCDGEPVVFDPAVTVGHREVELAYVELFGGFPASWRPAYERIYPTDNGYARRRPLLQLYPLLVHLNHFGEQYGRLVEDACDAALR